MNKTLVVILSETRASNLTFTSFKRNVVDVLDADVCVCIGVKDGYDYTNPLFQLAKYRFTYDEPSDYAVAFDYAMTVIAPEKDAVPWKQYLQIKDQFMGGIKDPTNQHPGSAGILIFFRWFLLHKLKSMGLLDQYERFVITRSDFYFRIPHPQMELMDPNFIWIPDGEQYGGYTDRHVVLSRQNIDSYLNILENMTKYKEMSQKFYAKMTTHNRWNLEKLIRINLVFNKQDENVRHIPYIMYSVREINGTTRWSTGVFNPNLQCFIKYQTEYDKSLMNEKIYSEKFGSNDTIYYSNVLSKKTC